MQTIVFDNFAGGYFKLYRGGAAVFGNKIIGKDKIVVRSFHNYHVPSTTHFLVNARSSDGYIEGMENTDSLFNLVVQWHPEANLHDEDSVKLFESFIDAAKVYVKKG